MIEKRPQLNHSTNKVMAILEYLANAREPVRLQTISVELGMNSSTVSRFLMSLEKNGYVQQEEDTRRYMLTMKICTLSYRLLTNNTLVIYAKPFLKKLSALFNEVSCLSIEQDQSVVYVATHDGPDNMLKSFNFIGKRAPMHCTGSGKLMLSNYSDEQLVEYIRAKGSIKPTQNTINTYRELKNELKQIQEQNYSIDNEECEIGMRCVAIPIRNYTGEIIAGLSVTGPSARMQVQKIQDNLPQLFMVSKQLSILLGYDENTGQKIP
ncbi:DNA-binding transcriptional regulator KdgR [Spirochaetia bacterium]|nr:DNA-binding transcriptional regulator KdgR [Spirochaetia bacterium]